MYIPFVGLCIGAIIGLLFPTHIPVEYSQYVAVAILASLDSVLGGINAKLKGTYKEDIFISGFFTNAVFAALLTYIGKRLDLDLYLAAIVVFGTRLFQNIAEIRRYMLKKYKKKDRIEEANN
jgi:small basic protein